MGECGEEQIWILFKCVKFLKSLSCFEIDIESNESPVKSICFVLSYRIESSRPAGVLPSRSCTANTYLIALHIW